MERLTTRNDRGIAVLKQPYRCDRCGEETWSLSDHGNREPIDKLAEYEELEEQGKLLRLPCAVGDFALFSNGCIYPVTYITMSNEREGITVGCQNGIRVSMNLQYGSWCKGFFKSMEEAEAALENMN